MAKTGTDERDPPKVEKPKVWSLPVPYETAPSRFVDPFLRFYGFRIVSRPSDRATGQPLPGQQWEFDGRVLFQVEAVRYAQAIHAKRKATAATFGNLD